MLEWGSRFVLQLWFYSYKRPPEWTDGGSQCSLHSQHVFRKNSSSAIPAASHPDNKNDLIIFKNCFNEAEQTKWSREESLLICVRSDWSINHVCDSSHLHTTIKKIWSEWPSWRSTVEEDLVWWLYSSQMEKGDDQRLCWSMNDAQEAMLASFMLC